MKKKDSQIIALPFLEFLRRIQREAGLLGNGARSLEWIHQRLQHSNSIREKTVLGNQVIWILREISPQLLSASWPKRFHRLSLGNRFSVELQALSNDSDPLSWVPGTVGCLFVERGNDNGFVRKLRFAKGYDRTFECGANLGPIATDTVKDVSKLVSKPCSIDNQGGDFESQWGFEGTSDKNTDIDGTSLGFAVVLGLISAFIDRDVSQIFVSGALNQAGRATAIKHAGQKVNAAFREWPGLKRIVLPIANRKDFNGKFDERIVFVSDLEELIEVCFGVLPKVIIDNRPKEEKLLEIQRLCKRDRQPVQGMKAARRFIKQHPGRNSIYERFQAGWYLVDCLIHLGRLDEASKVLSTIERQSRSLLEKRRIRPVDYLRVRMNRARIHWGRFNYQASITSLTKLIAEMNEFMALGEEEARMYGTLGQVLTHAGRFYEAEQALLKARLLMRDNPDEIPRECMLLGDLYRRMGNLTKGEVLLAKAIQLNKRAPTAEVRTQNAIYIQLARARLERAMGNWNGSIRESKKGLKFNPPFQPACLLQRELGVALWNTGHKQEAKTCLLKSSTPQYFEVLDSLARLIAVTSILELALLLINHQPEEAIRFVSDALSDLREYRPGMKFYGALVGKISRLAKKLEFSHNSKHIGSLTESLHNIILIIGW